jgi:ectoine hydroxylase-related dioxygenase (phytanoyl-CoA dioxygenase family)
MAIDSANLAQQFHERGLLIIENFLDPAKVAEIERELHRYIAQIDPEEVAGHVVYEAGSAGNIRNIFHLHAADHYFAELAKFPRFHELARAIFRDEPVLMSVELFGKPARVGSEVPHHQDNAYFNLIPDDALTCWVALADATEENGCVRYIEGSHRFGNLPHEASGVKGNSMKLVKLPPTAGRELCGVVKRGGALIHHCNTIHRSEPNRSDHDRPGLLFVYKSACCKIDATRVKTYRAAAALVNA